LDQLIEKIVAVSQLEETQTEYSLEFAKGRKLVEDITGLLMNISSLPPSSVFEPIIYLIEQRLQGQKIVDLTNFNKVMKAMLSEGIDAAPEPDIEPQAIPALAATTNQNSTKIIELTPTQDNSNIENNTIYDSPQQKSPLYLNENIFQANSYPLNKNNEAIKINEKLNIPTENLVRSDNEPQTAFLKEVPLSRNRINNSSLIPTEAARLALILRQIFPNSQARWNFCLGENIFLVQVEDLLIYLETLNEGENIEREMKKQGWNILICKKEDLAFPRRFERAIHRILKNSKHIKN
jgi:hypothetical protein